MKPSLCWWFLPIIVVVAAGTVSAHAEDALKLKWQESWGALFAGKDAKYHVLIESEAPFAGSLGWELRVQSRTLLRREQAVKIEPRQPATCELAFTTPDVKAGVALSASLEVQVTAAGGAKPAGTLSKTLWLFHPDAFAATKESIASRGLCLFDPVGETRKVLDGCSLTCRDIGEPDQMATLNAGVCIVGAGVSFEDYRSLVPAIVKAAENGATVLCLTPAAGTFPLPGSVESGLPPPAKVELRQQDLLPELDKRLDSQGWPPAGTIAQCGLRIHGDGDRVVAEIAKPGPDAWPWLAARYPSGGVLIFCGFPIVESWDAGPNPRYLLLRLLETAGKVENKDTR